MVYKWNLYIAHTMAQFRFTKSEKLCIGFVAVVVFLSVYLFLAYELGSKRRLNIANLKADVQDEAMQCKIPKLEMFNKEVMASYGKPKPVNCKEKGENWMFIDDNGRLQATEYAKKEIGVDKIKCSAKYFYRLTENQVKWEELGEVPIGYQLDKREFKWIECSTNAASWKSSFMNIVPQTDAIKDVQRSSSWSGLSVYWFSFDSISQMAFRRLLPKTVKYIEETMGAITLNGYNIVGDGTPQAFIPILTGKTEEELPLTRKRFENANFVNVYPFVWNNFSDAGYVTAYSEDMTTIGTFTYRLKGFDKQPTTHYTRPFYSVTENHFKNNQCFGSENSFDTFVRYSKEFLTKYDKSVPKFGLFHHSAFTHDSINDLQNLDDKVMNHFKELFDGGILEDTVVFIGADHGHRFSALRETQQGQLEERLPMMSVILPQKFRGTPKGKVVHGNLKENANRLTSPFDLYSTFLDILNLPDDLHSPQNVTSNRSVSLFRPIPKSRSCQDADIEPHWCTCLQWQKAEYGISQKLAIGVVDAINSYTKEERTLCAPLKLDQLLRSEMLVPDTKLLKYGGVSDEDGFVPKFNGKAKNVEASYKLVFTTSPGSAKYEATVKYNLDSNALAVDMLSISHINKYGNTPHCIIDKNYFMATYCVCYDTIS